MTKLFKGLDTRNNSYKNGGRKSGQALPHLKYVATLPCNLSLMACFADVNISRGSVATYAKCRGIVDIHLTANLPTNLPVEKNRKSVKN